MSNEAKENLADLGVKNSDITVLPNVIDVEKFQSSIKKSAQESIKSKWGLPNSGVVTYVGNLEFTKGVHDLIKSILMVDASCQLLVICGGPHRAELESLAEQLDDTPVTFTGQVPNSRLPNYYGLSDVFVLPTHSDTWGLVVNEALACGTPVISTTGAGVSGELLRDQENGIIVPTKSPDKLSEAIEDLLSNDKLRKKYGKAGLEISLQYTPQNYAEKIVNEIRSCIAV